MKKLLIGIGVVALLVWVATWFRAPEAVATSGATEWPGGLGTLESVAKRYPDVQGNDAAKKLIALGNALPKGEALTEFVGREVARGELVIGAPPALPDVTAIRELLLREPIVWPRHDVDIGDNDTTTLRATQMRVARALVASALVKARAQDAAAWEDLHAVWILAQSLDGQPPMMMQTAAFTMARTINAVAWKMPLPAPAWFGELQQRDPVRRLVEAFQHQAASYWREGANMFPTKALASSIEHDRRIAEAVFQETRCDVTMPMNELGVDLASVWRRAFRYRAEREAVANALRVREGKPIESATRCGDGGTWAHDGTTLRFSREIAVPARDRAMPLVLQVKP